MSKISEIKDMFPLLDKVTQKTKGAKTLENAAQAVADLLYQEYGDSIVLARVFATVPFAKLPAPNRKFVSDLAAGQNISDLLKDDTLVLSLLGSRGQESAWGDRRSSMGHVGIPLASSAFVSQIPMISRLLNEVGLRLDWIDRQESLAIKTFVGLSGVFHVANAKTTVDNLGRKIIAAQDFVDKYQVKTVFGLAGGYSMSKTFVTLIVFCRESVEKSQAERFLPLISNFKANTAPAVMNEAIFA